MHDVSITVSNREDWIDTCEVRDESNTLVNLTGAVIVVAVRDSKSQTQVLLAQTADGSIVILGTGTFRWTFPVSRMHGIPASKAYEIGCTIKLAGGITQQFFIGEVAVIDGIVP